MILFIGISSSVLLTGCHNEPVPPPFYYDLSGDLNVSNLIVNGRLQNTVPHLYGIASQPQLNPVINTWRNITWNTTTSYADGNISFIDTKTVEIKEDGDYKIIFGLAVVDNAPSPNAIIGFRIAKNGVQLNGSYFQTYTSKQSASYWIEHFTYADDLEIGDKLNMQYISDKTTVSINSMGTWNTGVKKVAYGYIERTNE